MEGLNGFQTRRRIVFGTGGIGHPATRNTPVMQAASRLAFPLARPGVLCRLPCAMAISVTRQGSAGDAGGKGSRVRATAEETLCPSVNILARASVQGNTRNYPDKGGRNVLAGFCQAVKGSERSSTPGRARGKASQDAACIAGVFLVAGWPIPPVPKTMRLLVWKPLSPSTRTPAS